ncbi:MAG TPA: ABC transporter substrate-binding protein [Xanthobacteraceae bacterium]|nr:ABC transporter substrate-binding protein [Xanthobacteraceae bacterium]
MRPIPKSWHNAAAAASVALALALPPAPNALAADLQTVTVIMPFERTTSGFALIAGEALGYFAKEGVKVDVLPQATTIPYVAFVQNGQADLAMLDAQQTFQAVQAQVPIKVIYEVMQRAPEGIAVPADSPIRSIVELKGKTVGLVSDRDRATLAIALDTKGIKIDEVTTVVVGEAGPTLANAFRKKTVAAIAGATPDWMALQANGIKIRMITPPEVAETPANSFVMLASQIDKKRKLISGFLRAWEKGRVAADIDREAVAAMCKKVVPEEWENAEFGKQFLAQSIAVNTPITKKTGDMQPDVWGRVQEQMIKIGELNKRYDPKTFLDGSMIDAANDFDRNAIAADLKAWRAKNM